MKMQDIIKKRRSELNLTYEELGKMVGVSKSTVRKWEKGMIENMKRNRIALLANALQVNPVELINGEDSTEYGQDLATKYNNQMAERETSYTSRKVDDTVKLPVYSSIACGKPRMVMEEVLSYEVTPTSWLNGGEYFYLIAKGDSMVGARISDGDLLLIRKQPTVEDGEIAAVIIDDECTLKRVYHHNGTLVLQAENPKYAPIIIKKGDVRIIGKLKKVIIKL